MYSLDHSVTGNIDSLTFYFPTKTVKYGKQNAELLVFCLL